MKSKVMDRPMFKQGMMAVEVEPMEEVDPENVGIMAGFKDMLADIELPEDEGEGEGDTAEMMGRTPDSPEILMNNLRGDMRSVDARKEELADLVGMRAASETPDSVLALLQPVLAGQMMPQMGPPSAPPGMPPMPPGMEPPMPPAPPAEMQPPMPAAPPPMAPPMPGGGIGSLPTDQGPVQMAQGGFVQRFSEGTTGPDEDQDGGVSPLNTDAVSYPPELTEQARTEVLNFLVNRKPLAVPDLASETARRQTVYQNLLGRDQGMTQAQILFDIAQGGLNMAAGVDAEGRPLRGPQSAVSRFSSAFSKVPGQIGARVSEQAKEDRAIKLAALQSAERDIEMQRTLSAKVALEQAKTAARAGKVSGSPFNQYQELIIPFVQGISSQADDIKLLNIVTELTKPTVVSTTDKMGNVSTRTTRADIPQSFADGFIAKYGKEAFDAWYKSLDPKEELKISPIAFPKITARSPTVEPSGVGEVSPVAPVVRQETDTTEVKTPAGAQQVVALSSLPADNPGRPVLWTVRGYLAGPINTAEAFIARNVPGMPPNLVDKVRKDAIKANEGLIEALSTNDGRISVDEMTRLRPLIGLTPRVFGGEGAMSTALVSIDDALIKEKEILTKVVQNPDQYLSRNIAEARMKINLIDTYRKGLGVPQSVFTEKEFQALPVYAEFVDKRNPQDFQIARKNTFSWRNEPAIREFQKNNPGKQYAVILPSSAVKIFTAPGKTQ